MDKKFSFRSFKNVRPKHLKKHPSGARYAAFVPLGNGGGFHLAKPSYSSGAAKKGNHFGVGVNWVHVTILAIATLNVNSHSYDFFL